MVKLTEFVPFILAEVGCTKATARLKLVQTCADFCARTSVWVHTPPPIRTRAGQALYSIPQRANTSIVEVVELKNAAANLTYEPVAQPEIFTGFGFIHASADEVELMPVPDGDQTLSVKVALKPTLNATEVADVLMGEWSDAILNGTLWRLKSMAGKEWSDLATANNLHRAIYQAELRRALNIKQRGHSNARLFVQPVTFGG